MKHTELRGAKDAFHTRPCRWRGRDFCQEWEPEKESIKYITYTENSMDCEGYILKKKKMRSFGGETKRWYSSSEDDLY